MSKPRRNAGPPPPDGLVIVDKPAGFTSHDVVGKMRGIAGTRKVGHAGTLDPMATGVLVIGVEKATRLLGHLALTEKTYEAVIRLGQTTVTDDAEGEVTSTSDASAVPRASVDGAVAKLTGDIMQVPSSVSAIKVDGKRSYKRVLDGEDVDLPARPVTVSQFDVTGFAVVGEFVDIDVTVTCSSGTYIRALARDLGADLGVGGHLTMLRRTRVGPYDVSAAHTIEQLQAAKDADGLPPILPIADAAAAAFPRRDVTAEEAKLISHGGRLKPDGQGPGPVGVFDPDGRFLALVENTAGRAQPIAVFV